MNTEAERALRAVADSFSATREDLQRIARTLDVTTVPTVAQFVPVTRALLSGRTLDTYGHHLDRLTVAFGPRRLDELSLLELEQVATDVRTQAVSQRGARHGFGAQESFVNATRFVFSCAVKAGYLRENPAAGLGRPRRRRSNRRALSSSELHSLFHAILATSRDPDLDLLILAFARETACRREGIVNLRISDVHETPSALLYEKFDEQREIPISSALLTALRVHSADRSPSTDHVFHYLDGSPLTDRRFDTMFARAGRALPWAKSLGVSLHWIRYSTLTDIRLTSGERVATAYAGHGDQAGGITALYTRASFEELQAAHRLLFPPPPSRPPRDLPGR